MQIEKKNDSHIHNITACYRVIRSVSLVQAYTNTQILWQTFLLSHANVIEEHSVISIIVNYVVVVV